MFIHKLSLPRRTFLQGLGATIALPFLDAMVPALTPVARAAGAVRRAAFIYFSNGTVMDAWTPRTAGPDFEFPAIIKPFEPLRSSATVVSGLGNTVEGSHPTASAGWLTGVSAKPTEGDDVSNGTSIDQILAGQVGGETLLPSLEIATEDFSSAVGSCAGGYSCIYANTISWRNPTTPLPMEIDPRAVFERMFGRAGSPAQRAARMRRQRSILDAVGDEIGGLRKGLGSADNHRLDEYVGNLREIEQRIEKAEKQNASRVAAPEAPIGIPDSHDAHLTLMFDLLAVAYQADVTRVASFYTSRELSQLTYPEVGVSEPHHSVSHHNNDPSRMASMALIGKYYAQQTARFVEKLRAMPEGDGTVLDHSMIFFGNGMANSNIHTHFDLPLIVLGGGSGELKGNQHVKLDALPLANLWLHVAHSFGASIDRFGNSTGPLDL